MVLAGKAGWREWIRDLFSLSAGLAIGLNVLSFSTRFETRSKAVPFRDFMRDVDAGRMEQATIAGPKVSGIYRADKEAFHTYAPAQYRRLANKLDEAGILIRRTQE